MHDDYDYAKAGQPLDPLPYAENDPNDAQSQYEALLRSDAFADNIDPSGLRDAQSQYEEFIKRYPMLFDMASRNDVFDWNSYNYFMNMRVQYLKCIICKQIAFKRLS